MTGLGRTALGLAVVLAACDSGAPRSHAQANDMRVASTVATAPVLDASVIDTAPPLWPARPGTFAAELQGAEKAPLVLVAEKAGIVVRGVDGVERARLVTGARQPRYDAELGVLWFVRNGRLEALDLGGPRGEPVVLVEAMPPLPFDLAGCEVCVRIDVYAATIRVQIEPQPDSWSYTDIQHAVRIAKAAHPELTEEGHRFLASLHDRLRPRALTKYVELDTSTTLPTPPAAGDLDRCDHNSWPRQGCCEGGCRHGFGVPGLGWQLVVAGRRCDCARDRCEALCVLRDPATDRFASLDHPERWGRDAKPLRCWISVDATGSAYLSDHVVCSARGCVPLHGDVTWWLTPDIVLGGAPEDMSACPE